MVSRCVSRWSLIFFGDGIMSRQNLAPHHQDPPAWNSSRAICGCHLRAMAKNSGVPMDPSKLINFNIITRPVTRLDHIRSLNYWSVNHFEPYPNPACPLKESVMSVLSLILRSLKIQGMEQDNPPTSDEALGSPTHFALPGLCRTLARCLKPCLRRRSAARKLANFVNLKLKNFDAFGMHDSADTAVNKSKLIKAPCSSINFNKLHGFWGEMS